MVNVAILQAIRQGRDTASQNDFEFAKDRIRMGIGRKSLTVSEKDKLITAYHEVGHALTSLLTKGSTPLHKVTILPRGGAMGFVIFIFFFKLFKIYLFNTY
jgi:ATP-dependent metalloprotease